MHLQQASLPFSIALLLLACGGTVSRNEGGASAGSSSSGGSGSGSSAGGGSPSHGAVSTGGSLSVGGAFNCTAVSCTTIDCAAGEVPVLQPGACCPTCEPKADGCESVTCAPVNECAQGYELAQPAGACCAGCVPKLGGVACVEIACPQDVCPLGYVRGHVVGGCCYDCVPDPLFCRDDTDCVLADQPRVCCGCPEAITLRQYEAEPCWSEIGSPRPRPQMCYPEATCDAACAPCQTVGASAVCAGNRCSARGFGLK